MTPPCGTGIQRQQPLHRLSISNILGAPCIVKMGVFRSNARIIKTSGDGINRCNLAVIILQEIGFHAMEDTWPAAGNGRCRFSRIDAASSCLHPDELDRRIGDKIIKKPHGIAAAAYAGHGHVGQAPLFFQHLLAHFLANDFLEIADHAWDRDGAP
mgnify:CR=1 FL=1